MTTTRKTLPKVQANSVNMGADPEFFFAKKETGVIGSEAILPKDGLQTNGGKIVIDGVQAELNPVPSTCRESLASSIRSCFVTLQSTMAAKGEDVKVDFSRSILISPEEMAKLEKANQRLGCAPSLNVFKSRTGIKLSEVDGSKHLQRSAGGHVHVSAGSGAGTTMDHMIKWNHRELVQMLDLIVGNTCVLLDRDPSNKERRKLYGKAGEYRLPIYKVGSQNISGLEYRTLSNFWLTSYPLMSLVFGLTRITMELMSDPVNSRLFYEEFTKAVPYAKVRHAINFNNVKLAEEIYRTIEPMLWEVIPTQNGHFPISGDRKKEFDYFISKIEQGGLEYWFKEDPMTHWIGLTSIGPNGFYSWMDREVKADMAKQASPLKKLQTAIGL
jgi:hypothetical protein